MTKNYKIVDHTADIGIEVEGRSLRELFIHAAEGLLSLAVQDFDAACGRKSAKKGRLIIKADDKEQLLVKWLQEILYLLDTKRLISVRFKINKFSEKGLTAEVGVVPFDNAKDTNGYQIKAITYHDLSIKKAGGHFKTTVIFDI